MAETVCVTLLKITRYKEWSCVVGLLCLLLSPPAQVTADSHAPPQAPREFRGVWIATLENIDWPSTRGLSTAQQKEEVRRILDLASQLKLNAVIVQIRSAADALYPSALEPWCISLTGQQGRAPSPAYDPLLFWIQEAHLRGIELHAWMNPCRAHIGTTTPAASHISQRKPHLVKTYGKFRWLDPGEPEAVEYSLAVLADVLQRYDVDAIHIDDYFYPYPIRKGDKDLPFPDDSSWNRYRDQGGSLSRPDWRRQNVNQLVEGFHTTIRRLKPKVRFGISPFGIGRPGTAPGITGFDQYEGLFADPALWLKNGWCDYLAPQLYWGIDQKAQSFPVLLRYWNSERPAATHLWPGLLTSRVGDQARPFAPDEIVRQVRICRDQCPNPGHLHFSINALQQNKEGLTDLLRKEVYAEHALIPASPWLDSSPPKAPRLSVKQSETKRILLQSGESEPAFLYAIWSHQKTGWTFQVVPGSLKDVPAPPAVRTIVVSAVDKNGNESPRVRLEIP